MADKKPTEIASLGEFGLIDHLTDSFSVRNASTLRGVGDDAAVIAAGADEVTLCTTDLLLEGVDFDLTYFPLKHLGYKAVVVAVSDLLAMNGRPEQLLVSLGVSSKISVEALDDLYAGIRFACEEMEVDLVGGDTKASVTGLAIHVTALGRARKEEVVYRGGAKLHDLICITGNLGAAYMGLQLLEREKRVLRGVKDPEPEFKGNEYLLQRYLKPAARKDIVELLAEEKIVPTSMIDLSDGLASDLLQICKASKCGARIYLDRIPIARQTTAFAEEIHTDPVVAALNGGEDYELLFTVPLALQERVMRMGGVDVIGHITAENTGAYLVTPDGGEINFRAKETLFEEGLVHLRMEIKDNGIGMSEEFLQHIFEPFTQEQRSSRTHYKGTGLGMAITKKLVDQMHGSLDVESEPGKGSTFIVRLSLPLGTPPKAEPSVVVRHAASAAASGSSWDDASAAGAETAAPAPAAAETVLPLAGLHLLLAEDNELNSEIATALLEEQGASITAVENGRLALEAIQNAAPHTYDAILMDVMMPEMNGLEATRYIRAFEGKGPGEGTPIIAMTANVFADDVKACLDAGMNSHVGKPLDMKVLIGEILKYTGAR